MLANRLVGTLSTTDSYTSAIHETGAKRELFQGLRVVYVRFALNASEVADWPAGAYCYVELEGNQSHEKVQWRIAIGAPGVVDCVREFLTPESSPLLYDETMTVSFETFGTGATCIMNYTIYYGVVQSTELAMVQQIAMY